MNIYEFCTEIRHLKKKKEKISLQEKLLTKVVRNAGNGNADI